MRDLGLRDILLGLLCVATFTLSGCVKDNRAAADGTEPDAGMTMGDQDVTDPETCEPGEQFEIACNVCDCPESGLREEASCTEQDCVDMMVTEPEPDPDMGGGLTVVDADVTDPEPEPDTGVEPEPEPDPNDADGDGVPDAEDNCPDVSNADQQDDDENGVGDICELEPDADDDQDGISNAEDNCPLVANNSQSDADDDGIGNRCDNCPEVANADQRDSDGNGQGDACADRDGDGVFDGDDNCPDVSNEGQADGDDDGLGDRCDNCPSDANADQADMNGNGVGDICEVSVADDSDLDGKSDDEDNCPTTPNLSQADEDDDGVGDACDNCPTVPNANQAPSDEDGIGAACVDSRDIDRDEILDADDNCPTVRNTDQRDTDDDGVGDACDNCREDANNNQADVDLDGRGDVCDPLSPHLIVELIWGDERADFDLHMVGPFGTFFGQGDCWSLNRSTDWCDPGYQYDSPRDDNAPPVYEQIRVGDDDIEGLHTIGVDLFPTEDNIGGAARVVIRCGDNEPVELGPWAFGTASGGERSFAEVAHVNPSTCEITEIQAFRSVDGCPGERCERSDDFVGGVCSPTICPAGASCDINTGECVDLCASQTCDEGLICNPDNGDCVETPISDWGNGTWNEAAYCDSDDDCEFTEVCYRVPFSNTRVCGIPCGDEGDLTCPSNFFCCDFRQSPDYCVPEGDQLGQNFGCQ